MHLLIVLMHNFNILYYILFYILFYFILFLFIILYYTIYNIKIKMNSYTILLTGTIGYGCLLILALQKFFINYGKHLYANMTKNFALVVSSLFLSFYYYKQAIYNLDNTNDINQKKIKIIGHAAYVINILLSLHPQITSKFKIFDLFGILGHSFLVYSTQYTLIYNSIYILGIIFLIIYFSYKLIYHSIFGNLEIFTNLILLVNYISLLIIYYNKNNNKNNYNNKNNNKNNKT